MELSNFACSICGESSQRICTFCTKDACGNHMCHRCLRCSDCCLCESPSSADELPVAKVEALSPRADYESEINGQIAEI